ncbi:MAG: Glutamate-tRNA ligase [Parcubacteria group bacterium GW2011_GWA2_47_16]|nr:MAG: Glutamate-tRNA ligase [Parcubacteria group bacterium GW2011_GWA2_47_16]
MERKQKVVTRFAPSPTGFMHMGSVRTALFAYLFARQNGGTFILRIEDTDKERSKKEFDDAILDAMKWLGLGYDGEVYRQSERGAIYRKHIEKLLEEGKAFVSKEESAAAESAKDGKVRRAEVIRFKNPNKVIKFKDLIRGDIEFDTTELGDFVIARSIDEPVFHLAVAVDDCEMGITHVIRGEDHISNTPRHILICEALGAPIPTFAHLPLVLAPDRTKLSKRKHGEIVSLEYYRKLGYLPEAILNFMALIGWNPGGNNEIFSLEELVKVFDLSKVQKGGAIFNIEKLNWFNKQYLQKLLPERVTIHLKSFVPAEKLPMLESNRKLAELVVERVSAFGELKTLFDAGEFDYFFSEPVYDKSALLWKGKGDYEKVKTRLEGVKKILEGLSEKSFNKDNVKEAVWPYADKEGRGEVLWPLRVSLSGKEKSPDPFTLVAILGKEETLARLKMAINLLS